MGQSLFKLVNLMRNQFHLGCFTDRAVRRKVPERLNSLFIYRSTEQTGLRSLNTKVLENRQSRNKLSVEYCYCGDFESELS